MRIAALGVTGGTGRHLVDLALDRGHEVVALARRPEALEDRPGLTRVRVDVFDPAGLEGPLAGADAVVSVLGVSGLLQARRGTEVYSRGTGAVATAMARVGARRLLVVTSGGVEPQPGDGWFYRRVLKPRFLEPAYRDMRAAEAALRAGDLDWTIVRPSFLVGDKPRTDYRVGVGAGFPDDATLSRWSLAHYLVGEAEAAAAVRETVWLTT